MSIDLDVPREVADDAQFHEVLRVWIAEDSVIALRNIFGEDSHNWGMVLADVAIHIARMKAELDGVAPEETLSALEDGYRGRMAEQHQVNHRSLAARH